MPINYILLLIFTVCETIMFSALCGWFDAETVIVAVSCTWMAASSLALAALLTPITWKLVKSLMIALLIGCLAQLFAVIGMICFGYYSSFYFAIWSTLGFGIAGLCIFIDVIIIQIQGAVSPDDYIRGALMLYIDLMRLLYYLLLICGSRR